MMFAAQLHHQTVPSEIGLQRHLLLLDVPNVMAFLSLVDLLGEILTAILGVTLVVDIPALILGLTPV